MDELLEALEERNFSIPVFCCFSTSRVGFDLRYSSYLESKRKYSSSVLINDYEGFSVNYGINSA